MSEVYRVGVTSAVAPILKPIEGGQTRSVDYCVSARHPGRKHWLVLVVHQRFGATASVAPTLELNRRSGTMFRALSVALALAVVLASASLLAQPAVSVGLPMGQDEARAVVGAVCFTTAGPPRNPCSGSCPTDKGTFSGAPSYNAGFTGKDLDWFPCACGGSWQGVSTRGCSGSP
jgi:hypothetical protein